jgi:hypothetical protein
MWLRLLPSAAMRRPPPARVTATTGRRRRRGVVATTPSTGARWLALPRGGAAEASVASWIPRDPEEVEADAKKATVFQCPAVAYSSFKIRCYRDGGGICCPRCGWSKPRRSPSHVGPIRHRLIQKHVLQNTPSLLPGVFLYCRL